jgi:hypothetical protein
MDTGAGPKVEYLLCGMYFQVDQRMLTDLNVWIADTSATVHTTPYASGMHNIKEATADDSVTIVNGTNVKALRVASITGMRCNDKHGNKLGQSELTDVTHIPNGPFNLFTSQRCRRTGGCCMRMLW